MFDLGNVFQLIVDRFDQRTLSQQDFVHQRHQRVFHVASQGRDEVNASLPKGVKQVGRNVTFVAKKFSEHFACQMRHRLVIIGVARRQLDCQQFAAFIDDEMEFETEKPTHRGFT